MEKNKIYFASDIHLGSPVLEDPKTTERRFVDWLNRIQNDAKALYLLGDIFDFWFEYKKVVPKGFTRFLGKIAEMHDQGIEIHFFTGNHDVWMFDYFQTELGVSVHREPVRTEIAGKTFYLAHGDGLGDPSRSFRFIRAIFYSRICQFLFRHFIPSRWGIGFGHWWSNHNRKHDLAAELPYLGEDKEHLVLYAKQYLLQYPDTDYLLFGHRHIVLDLQLNRRSRMLILGDWMRHFSYVVFDGKDVVFLSFRNQNYYESF